MVPRLSARGSRSSPRAIAVALAPLRFAVAAAASAWKKIVFRNGRAAEGAKPLIGGELEERQEPRSGELGLAADVFLADEVVQCGPSLFRERSGP